MSKTPKLRFPEFNGEWEEEVLSKLGSFSKGSGLSKADLTNEGLPCILYGELYTKYNEVIEKATSKTKVNNAKLVKSMKNDVLIPSSGETAIDIATASCVQENDVILGGDLNIFRSNIVNGIFLSYQLNNSKRKEIAKLAQGASVVHLYNDSLKKIKINLPGQEEQQKIASFLSLVDKKIEKQSEKVEAIKEYKKGMMQKIFSREIRFKDEDGKEYPEWEEKKLKDFSVKITQKNTDFLIKNVISNSSKNGLISQRDFFDKDIANKENINGYYIIETGDFVYNPRKSIESPYGPINRYNLKEKGVVSPLYLCFSVNEKINKDFLEQYFKSSKWHKFIYNNSDQGARHDRVSIKDSMVFNLDITLPCLYEQEKIANFLSTIDKKLEKEEEKLEALRTWKKGLLQQMFV